MATTPVNNSNLLNPLIAPKGKDAAEKAKNAAKADLASTMAAPAGARTGSALPADVKISDSAKDRSAAITKATEIAKNTPDIREDRVAALKAQIDGGTYQIDSGKIADGMMREAVKDRLAETSGR